MSSSLGSTLSGGIQDISAILPLLGTEQCEAHVGSSLKNGFLYAAVAHLSIFGSLGAVQSAFKIGFVSIATPRLVGARALKAAGFDLPGEVASMIMMKEEQYIIESRLGVFLNKNHNPNPANLTVGFN
ncbi:hypothetical protein K439DRAFT_1352851, partial [Ramaria rubella]